MNNNRISYFMTDIDIGPATFQYNSALNSVNKKGHSISHKH